MPTETSASAQAALQGRIDAYETGVSDMELRIYDSGFATVLLTFAFAGLENATNACPSTSTITGQPIEATASAGSETTAAGARLFNKSGAQVLEWAANEVGAVGAGGTVVVELSDTTVTAGQVYNANLTLSQPCS